MWIRRDPGTEQDAAAYASAELAAEQVNVRYRALGQFAKDSPVWIHQSHGVNLDVVDYLTARWLLDYGSTGWLLFATNRGKHFGADDKSKTLRHSYPMVALSDGLRERGYINGEKHSHRAPLRGGKIERFDALVHELVRLNVDIFVLGCACRDRAQ